MAIKITEDCISCDACISECPNTAIYEPNQEFSYSDGTKLAGTISLHTTGGEVSADDSFDAKSEDTYFIVTDKCTECKGFHDEPQCASVCPVDACVLDEDNVESEEQLLAKKAWLHGE